MNLNRTPKPLEHRLQELYDSEINCELSSFWDGGWRIRLGDELNGYVFEDEGYDTIEQALCTLEVQAVKHYPTSAYAKNRLL
jgi:hypothetical protein